jgi:TRAP-type C4-dicarboxylate transport system permease large subunit
MLEPHDGRTLTFFLSHLVVLLAVSLVPSLALWLPGLLD